MGQYVKKILILNGLDATLAKKGKNITGVVKIEKLHGKTEVKITLLNFALENLGEFLVAVKINERVTIREMDTLTDFTFSAETLSDLAAIECLVAFRQMDKTIPVAFATNSSMKMMNDDLLYALKRGGIKEALPQKTRPPERSEMPAPKTWSPERTGASEYKIWEPESERELPQSAVQAAMKGIDASFAEPARDSVPKFDKIDFSRLEENAKKEFERYQSAAAAEPPRESFGFEFGRTEGGGGQKAVEREFDVDLGKISQKPSELKEGKSTPARDIEDEIDDFIKKLRDEQRAKLEKEEAEGKLRREEDIRRKIFEDQKADGEAEVAAFNFYDSEGGVTPIDIDELKKKAQKRMESVENYSRAYDEYTATPESERQKGFYETVKPQLEALLENNAPCIGLTSAIKDSFWVKIDLTDKKYFVVGLIMDKNDPKYVCYGLPKYGNSSKPQPDFVEIIDSDQKKYWVLYQDASTGKTVAV